MATHVKKYAFAAATLVTVVFSFGTATPVLAAAHGSRKAMSARCNRLSHVLEIARRATGAAPAAMGTFALTDQDKPVGAYLTTAMPQRLVDVTTRF